jgi:hypothetical protein
MLALLALVPWASGLSCLPSDEGDAAAADEYLDLRGKTLCSMNFKCCNAPQLQEVSPAECEKRGVFHAGFKELEEAVADGTTRINLAAAETCFAEIRAMTCSAWGAAVAGAVPASCTGLFSAKANGQSCRSDAECSSQFCDFTSGDHTLLGPQPTGLCAMPAAAGGSCPAQQNGCVPGTQCRGSANMPMCTPFVMTGGACTKDIDCVSQLCSAGTCALACWAAPNSHHLLGTPGGF